LPVFDLAPSAPAQCNGANAFLFGEFDNVERRIHAAHLHPHYHIFFRKARFGQLTQRFTQYRLTHLFLVNGLEPAVLFNVEAQITRQKSRNMLDAIKEHQPQVFLFLQQASQDRYCLKPSRCTVYRNQNRFHSPSPF
jgi:hypothetical protein